MVVDTDLKSSFQITYKYGVKFVVSNFLLKHATVIGYKLLLHLPGKQENQVVIKMGLHSQLNTKNWNPVVQVHYYYFLHLG